MEKEYLSVAEVADMLSVSKETLRRWDKSGKLTPLRHPMNNYRVYHRSQLEVFEQAQLMKNSAWEAEYITQPLRSYTSIELFAGAGGLGLGLEKAGFESVLLNEIDKTACATLTKNRPHWNVKNSSITELDFTEYHNKVDLVSGGFPCQAFSYAGKKLGFEDVRGTLFYEFARCVKEVNPPVFLAENVRGLLKHDNGKTLEAIKSIIDELGYELIEPKVLKAIFYQVPQKRERLFLIGIRKDLKHFIDSYQWPAPYKRILTLRDALKTGMLYDTDAPESKGQSYPKRKKEIMDLVPPGGYWRDLPLEIQKEYMLKSFYLGGGKTGMARRLSWDEPSLTLTCAPAQKQTERCHPEFTRPLTTREYARIQTFPDTWEFAGTPTNIYKQIGNAVPVNLAYAMARSLVRLFNIIELNQPLAIPVKSANDDLISDQLSLAL
ncbi:DNA (cytosine-5-)-methyltransferase [Thiofilum flexile]|uniref:DNA (cytosine-5-)-methyltransferase n=1 Tax=Thiofilum flexile TaxID=125627 RepID=UPI000371A655|nr:DNA (cytosine-5-)-methyltransferase [Thiofilum flexile]